MKELLLTILRDKKTSRAQFRHTTAQLAHVLAYEAAELLPHKEVNIETPISTYTGTKIAHSIVLIPILRSGLALLPGFLEFFIDAGVGCIGLKRDEETAKPRLYYCNLPPIGGKDNIIILDPMIATGGSGAAAIQILKDKGIKEENMLFMAVIASQAGVDHLKSQFPKLKVVVPAIDKTLNAQFFIEPGLGDFGDRYFGTIDDEGRESK